MKKIIYTLLLGALMIGFNSCELSVGLVELFEADCFEEYDDNYDDDNNNNNNANYSIVGTWYWSSGQMTGYFYFGSDGSYEELYYWNGSFYSENVGRYTAKNGYLNVSYTYGGGWSSSYEFEDADQVFIYNLGDGHGSQYLYRYE